MPSFAASKRCNKKSKILTDDMGETGRNQSVLTLRWTNHVNKSSEPGNDRWFSHFWKMSNGNNKRGVCGNAPLSHFIGTKNNPATKVTLNIRSDVLPTSFLNGLSSLHSDTPTWHGKSFHPHKTKDLDSFTPELTKNSHRRTCPQRFLNHKNGVIRKRLINFCVSPAFTLIIREKKTQTWVNHSKLMKIIRHYQLTHNRWIIEVNLKTSQLLIPSASGQSHPHPIVCLHL